MRRSINLLSFCLALALLAACGSTAATVTPTDSEPAESEPAQSEAAEPDASGSESTPDETDTEPDEPATEEESSSATAPAGGGLNFDLQFLLPTLPDDYDNPPLVTETGEAMNPDDLNTESRWLWCEDDEGSTVATAVVGDIWLTGEGAGIVIEFDPQAVQAGSTIAFPSTEQFVLFLVDLHGREGIPEEYASPEEESFGSLELTAIPCKGEGDELAFTVDGAIGAETNPGFTAAAAVSGSFRMVLTGPPPPELFGE